MFLCILEHLINVLIYQKLLKQIFHNKRHPTKYTSKSTSEILDFLSDIHKAKYKERRLDYEIKKLHPEPDTKIIAYPRGRPPILLFQYNNVFFITTRKSTFTVEVSSNKRRYSSLISWIRMHEDNNTL